MKLRVLGCAGGIGGRERQTTSLLVDSDILLDAGTGLSSLDADELARIDHVFITHSHLDHIAGLPLLLDAVQGLRSKPLTVHANERVVDALKRHVFNWIIWPDFAMIPDTTRPSLRWEPLPAEGDVEIDGRSLRFFPVNHTAGSVAYLVRAEGRGFLFTGDMGSTPELWTALAHEAGVEKVIVECSFANADIGLAEKSRHFCPRTLLEEIAHVDPSIEFLIYHLKPGHEDRIMQELRRDAGQREFTALARGDVFEF